MALFAALLYGIITHQNASRAREAKANVERVRAACGNTQAVKFKVVYGNEPSEFTDESRQWAERCYQEGR